MRRPQFRLRSLFILSAIVAVGCVVGPPIVHEVRDMWFPSRPLPSDLAGMSVPTLPPLRVDELCSSSWYGEGQMGPVEDQNDDARLQASPPTE
jgi:hypothetical protein